MALRRYLLGLITIVLVAGCAGALPQEMLAPDNRLGVWVPDPSATLWQTEQSKLDNPTLVVVSNSSLWGALWAQAWGGPQAAPALPPLNFVLSSVIVVGLGRRLGLGHSVTIDSIVVTTVGAELYATEVEPGVHCDTSTGTSSPAHFVHYPGHPPVVEWHVLTRMRDCAAAG